MMTGVTTVTVIKTEQTTVFHETDVTSKLPTDATTYINTGPTADVKQTSTIIMTDITTEAVTESITDLNPTSAGHTDLDITTTVPLTVLTTETTIDSKLTSVIPTELPTVDSTLQTGYNTFTPGTDLMKTTNILGTDMTTETASDKTDAATTVISSNSGMEQTATDTTTYSTTKLTTDPNTKQTTYIMITDMTTQTASDSTTPLDTESTTEMKTEGPIERRSTRLSTTTPIEEDSTELAVTWVIDEINGTQAVYTDDLNDPNSEAYRNLVEALEMAIRDLLVEQLGETSLVDIRIDGFSPGSIIVDFTLIFNTNFTGNASIIQALLIEAVTASDGFVNGTLSPTVLRLIAELISVIDVTSSTVTATATTEEPFTSIIEITSTTNDMVTGVSTIVPTTDMITETSKEGTTRTDYTGTTRTTDEASVGVTTDLKSEVPSTPQTMSTAATEPVTTNTDTSTEPLSSGMTTDPSLVTDNTPSTDVTTDPMTDAPSTPRTMSTNVTEPVTQITNTGTKPVTSGMTTDPSLVTDNTPSTDVTTDPMTDSPSTPQTMSTIATEPVTQNTNTGTVSDTSSMTTDHSTVTDGTPSTDVTTDLTTDAPSTPQTMSTPVTEPVTTNTNTNTGTEPVTSGMTTDPSLVTDNTPSTDVTTDPMTDSPSTPQTMSTIATEPVTQNINTGTVLDTSSMTTDHSTVTDGTPSTDVTTDLTTDAPSDPQTISTSATEPVTTITKTSEMTKQSTTDGKTTAAKTTNAATEPRATEQRITTRAATTAGTEPCESNTCPSQEFCFGSVCECLTGKERQANGECTDGCQNMCDFETELCEQNACTCRPGRRTGTNGLCSNFVEYSASWTIVEVNGTDAIFTEDLNNPDSESYQILALAIQNAIRELLIQKLSGDIGEGTLIDIQINGFRAGSIISDFIISFTNDLVSQDPDMLQTVMYDQILDDSYYANDTSTSTVLLMLADPSGLTVGVVDNAECETAGICGENAVCVETNKSSEDPDGFVCGCMEGFTDVLQGRLTSSLDCREEIGSTEEPNSSGLAPWEAVVIAISVCAVAALLSFFCCLAYVMMVQRRRFYKQRFQDDMRPDPRRGERPHSYSFDDDVIMRNVNYHGDGVYPEGRGGADGPMFFAKVIDGSESIESDIDSVLDPHIERYGHSMLRMRQPPGPNVLPETALVPISRGNRRTDGRQEYSPDLSGKGPAIIYNDLAMH
eukprot:XP_011662858.1 PREDICTED: mucin-17 isoform X2 [Strongylocentrotus purpuratus]